MVDYWKLKGYPKLTKKQRKLVSEKISKEWRSKRKALEKRRKGIRLTKREIKRIKRSPKQLIRIGFEKARKEMPSIPRVD